MKKGNYTINDNFIEILQNKFPKKAQLTEALVDLLDTERETVYRRLRKEVVFTADEIIKIASKWNISLDELTGTNLERTALHLKQINYLKPNAKEINFLRSVIQSINSFKDFPKTEFLNICNKLPRELLAGYEYLNKFYLFKWKYQYDNASKFPNFSQITISEEQLQITSEYHQAIKQVPNSTFIWDSRLFYYLVNDIRYFYSVYLITKEEKEIIKEELHQLLDYMLDVAAHGYYPETHKKVNLYISQINIDTNYNYTFTPEANICFIHAFEKYEIYTFNSETVANMMTWMQLQKKTAIPISKVDEKNRIEFFIQQKILVNSL